MPDLPKRRVEGSNLRGRQPGHGLATRRLPSRPTLQSPRTDSRRRPASYEDAALLLSYRGKTTPTRDVVGCAHGCLGLPAASTNCRPMLRRPGFQCVWHATGAIRVPPSDSDRAGVVPLARSSLDTSRPQPCPPGRVLISHARDAPCTAQEIRTPNIRFLRPAPLANWASAAKRQRSGIEQAPSQVGDCVPVGRPNSRHTALTSTAPCCRGAGGLRAHKARDGGRRATVTAPKPRPLPSSGSVLALPRPPRRLQPSSRSRPYRLPPVLRQCARWATARDFRKSAAAVGAGACVGLWDVGHSLGSSSSRLSRVHGLYCCYVGFEARCDNDLRGYRRCSTRLYPEERAGSRRSNVGSWRGRKEGRCAIRQRSRPLPPSTVVMLDASTSNPSTTSDSCTQIPN